MNRSPIEDMIGPLEKRIESKKKLSDLEITALRLLLQKCAPEYSLSKKSHKIQQSSIPLGEESLDGPINPLTGYVYEGETGNILGTVWGDNTEWCGQFAGEKQWIKLGRKVMSGQKPSYKYELYGRTVSIYSYEQTIPL